MSLLYSVCTLCYTQIGKSYIKISVGHTTPTLVQATEVTPVQHR